MQLETVKIRTLQGREVILEYYDPNVCPRCKKSIKPHLLFATANESTDTVYLVFECKGCENAFVKSINDLRKINDPHSTLVNRYSETINSKFYLAPDTVTPEIFPESVERVSSNFVKIYNEAVAAESYNLEEIAGIGYRKSIEFLVKDYLIYRKPEQEETLKNLPLAKCIKDYVDVPKIKATAQKATWLGNDETHYMRLYQNKDISHLKNFIQAIVYWISMELITDEELPPPHLAKEQAAHEPDSSVD